MRTLTQHRQTDKQAAQSDPRWSMVQARDPAADKLFVYAVKTTGVYCRPSSPTRLPRPENIEFFDTPAAAEAAGYRASKGSADRTSLAAQHSALVAHACRRIENAAEPQSLKILAAETGLSRYYFHRVFKAVTGLTPKGYAHAHRAQKIRAGLGRSHSVTETIYDAGFNSSSRFYEASQTVLGMTPSDYRAGAANIEICFAIGACSLGAILVAQSQRGVCAILLGDDPNKLAQDLQDKFPRATLIGGDRHFEQLVAQVVGFIEAPALGLNLPLDVRGTAFQQRV